MAHRLVRLRSSLASTAAIALAMSYAGGAHAQGSASAQALFEEGRKLMADGKYGDACPKFADSEKLDPAPGTLLNLAKCYEKNGQSASAWATFKDAESVSKRTGHADWAGMAHDRAAALEPKLVRMTIAVPPTSEVEGLQLTRDGTPVARSEWNTPIPIDPGSHTIEATAPSTHKWTTSLTVDPSVGNASVTIPALEVERAGQPAAPGVAPDATPAQTRGTSPTELPPVSTGTAQRTAGYIVGGVGVLGLALGTVFGLGAKSKNNEALEPQNCRTSTLCTPNGLSLTSDAKSDATLSTVSFIIGGAAIAGGLVLILTAPSASRSATTATTASRVHVLPSVGPGSMGMTAVGTW